jgi:hypothetical protein
LKKSTSEGEAPRSASPSSPVERKQTTHLLPLARAEGLLARVALDERSTLEANLLDELKSFGDGRSGGAEGKNDLESFGVLDGLSSSLTLVWWGEKEKVSRSELLTKGTRPYEEAWREQHRR